MAGMTTDAHLRMPKKSEADAGTPDLPGVAAVSRALSVLCAFRNDDRTLSLAEISRRTGLYKSTVLRLTESLESYGFLVRDKAGDFRLGMEVVRLGGLARRSVGGSDDILATLQALMEATGESATYYVRRGDQRLALFRIDSPKSVRDHIRAGDLLPLELGAAGRVLKATDWTGNFASIVSLGERDAEVAAVAGPVYGEGGLAGALSISGPISRFTPQSVKTMSDLIEAECRLLSGRLRVGGRI